MRTTHSHHRLSSLPPHAAWHCQLFDFHSVTERYSTQTCPLAHQLPAKLQAAILQYYLTGFIFPTFLLNSQNIPREEFKVPILTLQPHIFEMWEKIETHGYRETVQTPHKQYWGQDSTWVNGAVMQQLYYLHHSAAFLSKLFKTLAATFWPQIHWGCCNFQSPCQSALKLHFPTSPTRIL